MILQFLFSLFFEQISADLALDRYIDEVSEQYVEFAVPTAQAQSLDVAQPVKQVVDGKESLGVFTYGSSAIVVDVGTGKVLFEKDPQEKRAIASMTKLMTALVYMDYNPGWETLVTLQESDERTGAYPKLYRGDTITARDLFDASLAGSDNNSTIALVRHTGLSMDEFVGKMNKKALQLGLYDTFFVEPTGLNEGNVSTAFDMSRLLHHTLKYEPIKQATTAPTIVVNTEAGDVRKIYNTDQLLGSYINRAYDIIGGKTGFINEAGYCLSLGIEHPDGQEIIVVVMNSDTNQHRFDDVKALAQWTFDNYSWEKK